MGGLKGVKPPEAFGERPRDCSLGHGGDEGPHLSMTGESLKNFPQFVVIHTIKGFGIVNKADVLLELSCFFYDPTDLGNLISGSSALCKSNLNIKPSRDTY